jgi:hypothetical protein
VDHPGHVPRALPRASKRGGRRGTVEKAATTGPSCRASPTLRGAWTCPTACGVVVARRGGAAELADLAAATSSWFRRKSHRSGS